MNQAHHHMKREVLNKVDLVESTTVHKDGGKVVGKEVPSYQEDFEEGSGIDHKNVTQ